MASPEVKDSVFAYLEWQRAEGNAVSIKDSQKRVCQITGGLNLQENKISKMVMLGLEEKT